MNFLQIYLIGIPVFMVFMAVLEFSNPLFRAEFSRLDAETQRTVLIAFGFTYFLFSLVWFISFFIQLYEMYSRYRRTGSIFKTDYYGSGHY